MKKFMVFLCATFIVFGLTISESDAFPVAVSWTGPSDFNDSTITFSPILTGELLGWTGNGYYHNHYSSSSLNVWLDIRIDSIWTNIFNKTVSDSDTSYHSLSTELSNITFTAGSVDAMRFISDPNLNQTYHHLDLDEANFDVVPEPTTMLLLGSGIIGLAVFRRRFRKR